TWMDGTLVGGLYGVGIGRMFFGESMFSWRSDGSKIALAALVAFCRVHGIEMIDCQQHTSHLASFGAREIPRAAFERHLAAALDEAPPRRWTYDRTMWAQLGLESRSAPQEATAPWRIRKNSRCRRCSSTRRRPTRAAICPTAWRARRWPHRAT